MRRTVVAFLFCLTGTIANAQAFNVERKLLCDKATKLIAELLTLGEKVIWQGKNSRGLHGLLLVNPESKTWSYITTDGVHACLLDAGEGYTDGMPAPKGGSNL